MSYIGRQPTPAALTASDVTDGIITTAKIADAGITNAKLNADIISGDTALGAEPADTDEFLVSDAGTLKRMDYSYIKAAGASDSFYAYDMSGGAASGDLVIDSELHDDGGNFDTSTGRYTAPSDGHYFFTFSAMGAGVAAEVYFKKNGSAIPSGAGTNICTYTSGGTSPGAGSLIISLSATDYISVYSGANVYGEYIWFGGVKLY